MRPTYKPPLKRKYYHKKRKISNKDMADVKKRIDKINQNKILKKLKIKRNKELY